MLPMLMRLPPTPCSTRMLKNYVVLVDVGQSARKIVRGMPTVSEWQLGDRPNADQAEEIARADHPRLTPAHHVPHQTPIDPPAC